MSTTLSTMEALATLIPPRLRSRSGKVFYSGRRAFTSPSQLYVLGVNPGGDPANHDTETVGAHTSAVLSSFPEDWSAYRDESWEGFAPGSYGMAPRVLHLLAGLGLDPGSIPCSNLVFARSSREADIGDEMLSLADQCWTFHAHAIDRLKPRVVLCFGKTAGNYVRRRVGANMLTAEFIEQNNRRWRSQVFTAPNGLKVVVATHPSVADWCAAATDPTPLVREALK
jgi:hypothetical protein